MREYLAKAGISEEEARSERARFQVLPASIVGCFVLIIINIVIIDIVIITIVHYRLLHLLLSWDIHIIIISRIESGNSNDVYIYIYI